MRFENVKPIDRQSAEKAFSSGENSKICDALLRATYHVPDWQWVQEKCIYFLSSKNNKIKSLAVICLGHLARIHRDIDVEIVLPLLNDLLDDPDFSGCAEDAID